RSRRGGMAHRHDSRWRQSPGRVNVIDTNLHLRRRRAAVVLTVHVQRVDKLVCLRKGGTPQDSVNVDFNFVLLPMLVIVRCAIPSKDSIKTAKIAGQAGRRARSPKRGRLRILGHARRAGARLHPAPPSMTSDDTPTRQTLASKPPSLEIEDDTYAMDSVEVLVTADFGIAPTNANRTENI